MKIDIHSFKSAVTALEPELIGDNYATNAVNVETIKGSIRPIKQSVIDTEIATTTLTDSITRLLFRDGVNKLMQGANNERWLSSPLAQDDFDRIYYTSNATSPKTGSYATIESSSFDLGLDAPPVMSVTYAATGEDIQASSALFVEESVWGELSAPCDATAPFKITDAGSITLNMPDAPTFGHWTHRRIYIADYAGNYRYYSTVLNTAATIALTMPFDMDLLGEELDQIAEGAVNSKPRPGLKGLTAIPGGFFAGYDNNVIAFSKQYLPHAWPVNYEITVDGNVQAMAFAASGLVVLTDKNPYLIAGGSPDTMYPVQLDITEPCFSAKAVVDMGSYVIYPSNDGLLAIAGSDNRNIIEGVIDKDEWRTYVDADAVACLFNGKYWYFTGNGGFVFDVSTGSYAKHDISAVAVYADQLNDKIYFVSPNGDLNVYARFNVEDKTFTWESKHFSIGMQESLSCAKIDGEGSVTLSIDYMTNNATTSTFSQVVEPYTAIRLPVENAVIVKVTVSGTSAIKRIQLASSMMELN
jgi:hypothetical protein